MKRGLLVIPKAKIPKGRGLGRGERPNISAETWKNPKLKEKVWPKK